MRVGGLGVVDVADPVDVGDQHVAVRIRHERAQPGGDIRAGHPDRQRRRSGGERGRETGRESERASERNRNAAARRS